MHPVPISLLAALVLFRWRARAEPDVQLFLPISPALNESTCCTILHELLPEKVFFQGSSEYDSQQVAYYSSEQTDLQPSCRVTPTSSADVSIIVKIAVQSTCDFAVKSGGHMAWKGASNVGSSGFTVDVKHLNHISVSENQNVVSFGSGCRWRDVYGVLEPLNLTTVGGRSSDVGVGGFLLGGGISFLSLREGFGSSNIVNYEVVLADGSITDVNEHSHSDLYWALKLGSTNYGIVTRFDMITYPQREMWGGALFFDISQGLPLLDALVDFTQNLADDPKGVSAVSLAYSSAQGQYGIWAPSIYLEPVSFRSPLFTELSKLEPLALLSTMRVTSLLNLTDEVQATAPQVPNSRVQWFTLTLKANGQLPYDMFTMGQELFAPYLQRPGFTWALTLQPINTGLSVASSSRNGGNPSSLSEERGNLILLLGSVFWTDPSDDDLFTQKTADYLKQAEDMAKDRDLLDPFIYMNYAFGGQDVLGSFGAENLGRMRKIQSVYDPKGDFAKLWKGGWKL